MYREVQLKLKSEADFAEANLSARGAYLLQAMQDLRRHSHLGSLNNMDQHWESILGAQPGTHHVQFLTTFVLDVQKSVESVYAQNLEIMDMLRTIGREGTKGEKGSDKVRASASDIRSIKGTVILKEIRSSCEQLLLEQPLGLREGGKQFLKILCRSRLLWPDSSYEESVSSFIKTFS